MLAFMDGLVVHAKTGEGPDEIVLEELRLCGWVKHWIEFLGYTISGEMATKKIQTLRNIKPMPPLKGARHFTGSKVAPPARWQCTPEIETTQRMPVELFASPPVLKHFDRDLPVVHRTLLSEAS